MAVVVPAPPSPPPPHTRPYLTVVMSGQDMPELDRTCIQWLKSRLRTSARTVHVLPALRHRSSETLIILYI